MISNTTVYGFGAHFSKFLESGDTLIITNPSPKDGEDAEEQRKITLVVGKSSQSNLDNEKTPCLSIAEPFSYSPEGKIGYKYQKKPIVKEKDKSFDEFLEEKMKERKEKKKKKREKVRKFILEKEFNTSKLI